MSEGGRGCSAGDCVTEGLAHLGHARVVKSGDSFGAESGSDEGDVVKGEGASTGHAVALVDGHLSRDSADHGGGRHRENLVQDGARLMAGQHEEGATPRLGVVVPPDLAAGHHS